MSQRQKNQFVWLCGSPFTSAEADVLVRVRLQHGHLQGVVDRVLHVYIKSFVLTRPIFLLSVRSVHLAVGDRQQHWVQEQDLLLVRREEAVLAGHDGV